MPMSEIKFRSTLGILDVASNLIAGELKNE